MDTYVLLGAGALATYLTKVFREKQKEASLVINDINKVKDYWELNVTDGTNRTYRVYGYNLSWWYKSNNEKVNTNISKALLNIIDPIIQKEIKASLNSKITDDVIIRDNKPMKRIK